MKPFVPFLFAISAILIGLFSLQADGAANSRLSAAQRPFSITYVLSQGQSVAMPVKRKATLRLDRINDSRCRPGDVCVWKGYISYSFIYRDGEAGSSFVLAEDMPGAASSITQNGLTFTLAGLAQQASADKNETRPDYRVSLRVSNTPPP